MCACAFVCVRLTMKGIGTSDYVRLLVGFALLTVGAWPTFALWVHLGDEVTTLAGVPCGHTQTRIQTKMCASS